jgi:hypothetical protein
MELIIPRETVLCIAYSHQSPVSASQFSFITISAIKILGYLSLSL